MDARGPAQMEDALQQATSRHAASEDGSIKMVVELVHLARPCGRGSFLREQVEELGDLRCVRPCRLGEVSKGRLCV